VALPRAHVLTKKENAMGKHRTSDVIEAIFWLALAVIFFSVSFQFNQPIEIYKFGATGWPRVILFLTAVVAIGNFYQAYTKGAVAQKGRVGASEEAETVHYKSFSQYLQTAWLLILPLIYAMTLKPVGFYCGTPFFIALIMVAWGERRVSFIIYNTLIIYGLLLLLFMVVLNAPLPQGNVSPFYDVSAFILRMKTQLDQLL
jgi:hypothetical protein|tara:strand:- start:2614 stop:3216 length:603 start_codon:yes stop_codon:yes gene_type:complete